MQIRKLNALRGLAALIVFVTHFSDITNWLDGRLGGGAGAYGVMLFFLLSGFLMAHLYMSKAFSKANVKRYVLARAGRVLPLYLLIVFGSYVLSLTDNQLLYNIPDVNTLVGHLLFLYGESVLWTIPVEVQFYCIFIAFWALAKSRPGYIYVAMLAVMIFLFLFNFPRIYGGINGIPYNEFNVIRSLPFFFVGVIFGMHYESLKVPDYLRKHWFVLALCLIPLLYPEFTPVTSDAKRRMWLSYEVLLVMSSVFFCLVYLVPNNNLLLANKVGDFFGKISYSLYLIHLPIIELVNRYDFAIEVKFLLSFGFSVLIAFVSFKCFEKPVARLLRGRSPDNFEQNEKIAERTD